MGTKIGRNDPCACGSGKKYKRCCLEQGEEERREALLPQAASQQTNSREEQESFADEMRALDQRIAELEKYVSLPTDYELVLDLIHADSLDQAEAAAGDLLTRFPELVEGHECLGMVDKARGEYKQAADHYREALQIVRARPEDFEPEVEGRFQQLIDELDRGILDI